VTLAGFTDGQCATTITPTANFADANLASTRLTLDGATFVSGTAVTVEGDHTVAASAVDRAGNSASTQGWFTIDRSAPAISVTGVADGQFSRSDVAPVVTIADTHLTSSTVTLNGIPFAAGDVVSADGPYLLHVEASDCAGNRSVRDLAFTVDKSPPAVSLGGVVDGQCAAAVTPTAAFDDANLATTSLTLDGSPFVSGTTVTAEGRHVLEALATDRAGNTTHVVASFTVDHTAPTVVIAGVLDGQIGRTDVSPVVAINDANLTSQTVTLDGVPFTSGATVAAEGDHLLAADATDCAGATTHAQARFTIDKTAPTITITGVVDGQTYSQPVTPVYSAADAHLDRVDGTLDGAPLPSGTSVGAAGSHLLTVTATDRAGNQASRAVRFAIGNATLDGARGGKPAVLVGLDCGDAHRHPDFLVDTLRGAGYPVTLTHARDRWLDLLRSDAYGVLVLYRPTSDGAGDDAAEANEAVVGGTGLIVIGGHLRSGSRLEEALGARRAGELTNIESVRLTGALGSGLVPARGHAQTLALAGATSAGTVHGAVVASTNQIGLGYTVLVGWNSETMPSPALSELYLRAAAYVTPKPAELIPGGVGEAHFGVHNLDTAGGPASLLLTLDPALAFENAQPALSFVNPIGWVIAGPDYAAWVRLPQAVGSYPVQGRIIRAHTPLGEATVALEVARTRDDIAEDVVVALQALALGRDDARRRDRAAAQLLALPRSTNGNVHHLGRAIDAILDAIDDTRAIVGADTSAIRVDEARLLRAWEVLGAP
jgi:hypothetical protein